MTRFDEQPSTESKMWRTIGLFALWIVFGSFVDGFELNSDTQLVAFAKGVVLGIGTALIMALLPSDDDDVASAGNSLQGFAALARRYFVFVILGLLLAKFGYELASGLAAGEQQALRAVGFMLGLFPLSMLIPKLRLGRKV